MSKYTSRSATNRAYSSSLVDKFIARVEGEIGGETDKPLKNRYGKEM
jgi:hypothetical protein